MVVVRAIEILLALRNKNKMINYIIKIIKNRVYLMDVEAHSKQYYILGFYFPYLSFLVYFF
jgi:hypothetical protein